jgi:hypothetical protein
VKLGARVSHIFKFVFLYWLVFNFARH